MPSSVVLDRWRVSTKGKDYAGRRREASRGANGGRWSRATRQWASSQMYMNSNRDRRGDPNSYPAVVRSLLHPSDFAAHLERESRRRGQRKGRLKRKGDRRAAVVDEERRRGRHSTELEDDARAGGKRPCPEKAMGRVATITRLTFPPPSSSPSRRLCMKLSVSDLHSTQT